MRQIGKLASEKHADRFVDHLLTLGIHAKVDKASDGQWILWIHEENHVDQAKSELDAFRSNPDDARYVVAAEEATGIRKMEQLRERERRKNIHEVKPRGGAMAGRGLSGAPVTKVIMVICISLTALGMFFSKGNGPEVPIGVQVYSYLGFISPQDYATYRASPKPDSLLSIERGQVWRLITPAFLHDTNSILHIAFNMYMFYMLGSIMEPRLGSAHFLMLNLGLALASNLAQGVIPMLLVDTPLQVYEPYYGGILFVGYSGVIYGLFGYLWMRSKYDPTLGIMLNPTSILILMVWFVLCWMNVLGNIANLAHTGGLVVGIITGLMTAARNR